MSHVEEEVKRINEIFEKTWFPHLRREALLQDIALELAMILDKLEEGQKNADGN